ncbi:O-antigen ligase family protein [Cellulomonas citrea]|uniref:O-antigen ligase family protein n=1 Tax=Cellulomonas citrea TaxID=1909423 RepID=UPI00135683E8|nr:O-antigen ligase family protein [Cellulomonas citrea]
MTGRIASDLPSESRSQAALLLRAWALLLLVLPAKLVVGALGAVGSPAQILGMLAAVAWFVTVMTVRAVERSAADPIRWAYLAFAVACLVSYLMAVSRPIESIELSAADRGMLLVMSWGGVLLTASDLLRTRRGLTQVLRTICLGGAVAAAVGLVQYFTGDPLVTRLSIPGLSINGSYSTIYSRNGFERVAGTSTHPIEFGVLMAMVLPIALHLAFHDTARSRVRRWTPVVLLSAAVPIAMSRSALIGLGLVLLLIMPTWTRSRRRAGYVALIAGIGAVYVTVPGLIGTMTRLFTGISGDTSAQSRVNSYDIALHFAGLSPLFGRGFGTFLPRYRILDNQYLGMLVEIGAVGLCSFVVLLVTGVVVTRRVFRMVPSGSPDRSLAMSLLATVVAAAAACATFDAFGFPQVGGLLFAALGLLGALARMIDEENRPPWIQAANEPDAVTAPIRMVIAGARRPGLGRR